MAHGLAVFLGASRVGAALIVLLWLGLVITFLAALLASGARIRLVERRRLPALSLWIIPLGLALLAYARALPASGS